VSYGQKWNFGNGRLICILLKTLKGARVASSGFLISTLQRYKNCKKNFVGTPKQGYLEYGWTIIVVLGVVVPVVMLATC